MAPTAPVRLHEVKKRGTKAAPRRPKDAPPDPKLAETSEAPAPSFWTFGGVSGRSGKSEKP
jgi:hypothetical protein